MQLMTPELREQLIANGKDREGDHRPLVKFFNPAGASTWLVYAMDPDDNDYLRCLADLGMGFPELGGVLLSDLQGYRGPFGLGIERDLYFEPKYPVRIYAAAARIAQRIVESGPLLEEAAREAGLPVAEQAAPADSDRHRDAVREPPAPQAAVPGTAVRRMAHPGDLPAGHNRHRDAVLIVDPGACNPSGIALSLYNACRQVIAEGGDQRTDPAAARVPFTIQRSLRCPISDPMRFLPPRPTAAPSTITPWTRAAARTSPRNSPHCCAGCSICLP